MIKKEPFIGSFIFFFANFTESSSTFTVPKGVKKIDVFCVGGGGGSCGKGCGGGGGGYTRTVLGASVTPGQQLSITVGAGGAVSSVGDICSAKGGKGSGVTADGGNGGSGGGCFGSAGGQDGHDGASINDYGWYGGKGQGTTTRYFGESTGTLYSTGGCGYMASNGWYSISAPGDGASASFIGGNIGASGICIIRWGKQ